MDRRWKRKIYQLDAESFGHKLSDFMGKGRLEHTKGKSKGYYNAGPEFEWL